MGGVEGSGTDGVMTVNLIGLAAVVSSVAAFVLTWNFAKERSRRVKVTLVLLSTLSAFRKRYDFTGVPLSLPKQ